MEPNFDLILSSKFRIEKKISGFFGSSKTCLINAVCPLNAVAATKCGVDSNDN